MIISWKIQINIFSFSWVIVFLMISHKHWEKKKEKKITVSSPTQAKLGRGEKRMILRNDTAQFLLNLLARFSLELQNRNLQLCLIKGISKKLSNIKRMILRNKIAQFLLHLSATLSKVMELCPLRHFIKFKHLQNWILQLCLLGISLTLPRLKPPMAQ